MGIPRSKIFKGLVGIPRSKIFKRKHNKVEFFECIKC